MAEKFRIALSHDFLKPDGAPAFPMFDRSPMEEDPNVEWAYLKHADGPVSAAELEGYDALILLAQRFERQSIPPSGRLSVVARFGVGYDTVDVDACSEHAIAVVITPDGVRRPVAVAVITLMLAVTGKLLIKDRLTRMGPEGFAQKADHMGLGLVGRTLGSIGLGNIGAEVFRLAKPFDMKFLACDPYANKADADELGVRLVDLDTLFRESDVLAVNCLLNKETRHIVNAERLALMKPTAYLINTSRGGTVDQKALTKALEERRIAGAGLDVLDPEPPSVHDPILKLDNVILNPHALCYTDQCFAGIGAVDVKAVFDVMKGREPSGIVNRNIVDNAAWRAKLDQYRSSFG